MGKFLDINSRGKVKIRNPALLSASFDFTVLQNKDIQAMSVTRDEVGEDTPPGQINSEVVM